MFPITLKWVDDIYDKIESVCSQVDDIVSKEQESSKYVESLKNVGNNVKQFCSTMDPLQYAEDQLNNLGATIEQLCSIAVPSSMDTMLSAVNNIFPVKDPNSTPCKNPELNDSVAEPITSVDMDEEVASTGKLESLKLNLEDNTTQTDQTFDEDSSPVRDKFGIDNGSNPCQISIVERKEITRSPKKTQFDESCVVVDKNDWLTSPIWVDIKSPQIKRPPATTSKLRNSQRRIQMRTNSKSSISAVPDIIEEPAFPLLMASSNLDTWESEWEII